MEQVKNEDKKPGLYAYMIIYLLTLVRISFVVQKNSIGYSFGYQGTGFRQDNPTYMLSAAYPNLAPIYGIVASLMFSAAYSTSNIVMS